MVCGKGSARSFTALLVNGTVAVLLFMENATLRGESLGDRLDEDTCVSPVRQLEGQQVLRLHVPRYQSPYEDCIWILFLSELERGQGN